MILLGDIGGTHARFQLCERGGWLLGPVVERSCADFSDIGAVIADVLPGLEHKPAAMLLAVAGPVEGDFVQLTNLEWRFSGCELAEAAGVESCAVINDAAATAWSLPVLDKSDRLQIGGGDPNKGAAMAVIGPGTGLGVAALVPAANGWTAMESEGGHATLAVQDAFDADLLKYLQQEDGHVSYETVLSGPGIVRLYRAICAVTGADIAASDLLPEDISRMAAAEDDPAAQQTFTVFCRLLGSYAGDLALIYGARGGIFIGGGIVLGLGPLFDRDLFRRNFEAKGRLSHYVASIGSYLIVKPQPALTGLAHLVNASAPDA